MINRQKKTVAIRFNNLAKPIFHSPIHFCTSSMKPPKAAELIPKSRWVNIREIYPASPATRDIYLLI